MADLRASPRLQVLDFGDYVEQLTTGFVGRDWVFREIDAWLSGAASPFCLVTAEAGVGKSALAAQVVRTRADVAAHHFCIAGQNSTIVPGTALRSLAAQLAISVPGYSEALVKAMDPARISINVDIKVENLHGGRVIGLVLDSVKLADPRAELQAFITAAFSNLSPPPRPMLLVVDSLDEALAYGGADNLVALFSELTDLPSFVRILMTSRADERVLAHFPSAHGIQVAAGSPLNRGDLERYVRRRLDEPPLRVRLSRAAPPVEPEKLVEQIAGGGDAGGLADGNFLYAKLLLDDIGNGAQPLDDVAALPHSLDRVYERFLLRLAPEWEPRYQPILSVAVAAREPLNREQLSRFGGVASRSLGGNLSATAANRAIAVLVQFLRETRVDGVSRFNLFHQSIADYLRDPNRSRQFACPPEDGHSAIASWYVDRYGLDWSDCDDYGVRHVAAHLMECRNWDGLVGVVTAPGYLERVAGLFGARNGFWSGSGIYEFLRRLLDSAPQSVVAANRRTANIFDRPLDKAGRPAELGWLSEYQERNLFSFATCLNCDYYLGLGTLSGSAACRYCRERSVRYGVYDFSRADYYEIHFVWCVSCFWSSFSHSHSDDVNYIPMRFNPATCAWDEDATWFQR